MTAEARRRLGVAQVEALFDSILVAAERQPRRLRILVGGARLPGIGGALDRVRRGFATWYASARSANLSLRYLYRRSRSARDQWRVWALGSPQSILPWGSVLVGRLSGLTIGGSLDVELLTLLVTLCVAAGAITVFGPYLPAFLSLLSCRDPSLHRGELLFRPILYCIASRPS